jgi:hypothetical protein
MTRQRKGIKTIAIIVGCGDGVDLIFGCDYILV